VSLSTSLVFVCNNQTQHSHSTMKISGLLRRGTAGVLNSFSTPLRYNSGIIVQAFSSQGLVPVPPKTAADTPLEGERLAKMIAKSGICGRREAEKRIREERVTLNGRIVLDVAQRMVPTDDVWLDEHKVEWGRQYEKLRLWAVHKPCGELVADADNLKRRALLSDRLQGLIREVGEIKPVTHLDYNTEGLVLYTNNGRFARLLGDPATGVKRVFKARVHGLMTESKMSGLKRGLVIKGSKYSSMRCHVDRKFATNSLLTITCTDYKARQIPTCLDSMFLKATKLVSSEFGSYKLGGLKLGAYKEVAVTPELERLYYNHTRKDVVRSKGGAKGKKVASVSPKKNLQNTSAMTDQDLDDIFIDNSGENIKVGTDEPNSSEKKDKKKRHTSTDSDSSESSVLKQLTQHLKEKRERRKEEAEEMVNN
jgi:23S rRNA pseudouridine2605 synthase